MAEKAKTKYRIELTSWVFYILLFFAVLADLLGLIPLVKDITATLFWGGASIYFWKKGMGLFSGKKLAAMSISWVASLIPVLQEIPAEVTAGFLAVVFITRVEDKTDLKVLPTKKGQGITAPRLNRNPFNGEPGIRRPNNIVEFKAGDTNDVNNELSEAA